MKVFCFMLSHAKISLIFQFDYFISFHFILRICLQLTYKVFLRFEYGIPPPLHLPLSIYPQSLFEWKMHILFVPFVICQSNHCTSLNPMWSAHIRQIHKWIRIEETTKSIDKQMHATIAANAEIIFSSI